MSATLAAETPVLPRFIKYLERENLAEFDILGDGDSCLWNWFKIQKYAFLAKRFGLDLPYEHDICLWGPYSQIMGDECWDLAENRDRYDGARPELPQEFRNDEFLDFVRGRSNDWLQIATTLLDMREYISKRDDLVENTESINMGITREFVDGTLRDLESANLIECSQ